MKAKKSEKKKGLGALAEVKLVEPSPGIPQPTGEEVHLFLVRDIEADPGQPRKLPPPGPALEAAVEDIASTLAWDEDGEGPREGHGIRDAIQLRKMPDGHEGKPWRIFKGERRWTAAKLRGFATIPGIEVEIDESQVLLEQLLEFGATKPLSPLEMADAVARLMAPAPAKGRGKPKVPSAADIAERIGLGKLPRPVHEYLALAGLGSVARDALAAEQIGIRVALALAGIADPERQAKACDEVQAHPEATLPRPARAVPEALRWIRDCYTLRLAAARFDTGDPSLLPAAGACSTCPCNTASQAQLFAEDDKDARCTKPTCYGEKLQAHREKVGETGEDEAPASEEQPGKGKRGKKAPKLSEVTAPAPVEPTRPTREQIERLSELLDADADEDGETQDGEDGLTIDERAELDGLCLLASTWAAFRAPAPRCCPNPEPRVNAGLSVFCRWCLAELADPPTAPPAIPDPPAAPSRFSPLSAAEGARLLTSFRGARASFPAADWAVLVAEVEVVLAERPVLPGAGAPSEVREETAPTIEGPSCRVCGCTDDSPCSPVCDLEDWADRERTLCAQCAGIMGRIEDTITVDPRSQVELLEAMEKHDSQIVDKCAEDMVKTGRLVVDSGGVYRLGPASAPAEEPVEARCRAHLLAACTDLARIPKWLEGDAVRKGGFAAELVREVWAQLKSEGAVVMRGTDRWQKAPSYEPAEVAP